MFGNHPRRALVALVPILLVAAGCSATTTDTEPTLSAEDCAPYEQYGDLNGQTVEIYSGFQGVEADYYTESWAQFAQCTGLTIDHEATSDFEVQLQVRAKGNSLPDIALDPSPARVLRMADEGYAVPVTGDALANLEEYYPASIADIAKVGDEIYGTPLGFHVKSLVWYDPSAFEAAGYEVPETWEELQALNEQIADDGSVPWCVGFENGVSSGWPGTDWHEIMILRTAGAEVFDQWVAGDIPFDDPRIVDALDAAGDIIKDPRFVNGGFGDPATIAVTPWADAALPVLQGGCSMHMQGDFLGLFWPEGTEIGPDGDVYAFPLPTPEGEETSLLINGEYAVAFNDDPATQAVQAFLTSPEYSNSRAALPGWMSANSGMDIEVLPDPVMKLAAQVAGEDGVILRFDASDRMSPEIGAGTYLAAINEWITGADAETVLRDVEQQR